MSPLLLVVQKDPAVVLNFIKICWFLKQKFAEKKSAHRYLIEIEKKFYGNADYSF